MSVAPAPALLDVVDLRKTFSIRRSSGLIGGRRSAVRLTAVDGVTLAVRAREVLAIVGESGSGKTTLARCLIGLHRPDSGSVVFGGIDLVRASHAQLQEMRKSIQMVFQDPYSSLNPRMTVGQAIAEPARVHGVIRKGQSHSHVEEMLHLVGLPSSVEDRRPRQLSGGQRQRVAIARALSVRPSLVIADEPISALDVSIQAQILNLFDELVTTLNLTLVMIAHQLSVVRYMADRVAIMYLGRLVEFGETKAIFENPQHPYTKALIAAAPRIDAGRRERSVAVVGEVPSPINVPTGCRFRTRCSYATAECAIEDPPLQEVGTHHSVACLVRPFAEGHDSGLRE